MLVRGLQNGQLQTRWLVAGLLFIVLQMMQPASSAPVWQACIDIGIYCLCLLLRRHTFQPICRKGGIWRTGI